MEESSKRIKIIYIAGYGRSGSTLLDIILSNAEYGHSLGEIFKIFREKSNISDEYYTRNLNKTLSSLNLSEAELNKIRVSDKWNGKFSEEYSRFWKTFLNNIFETEKVSFFVDSSKTTWHTLKRPKNLIKSQFEVYIIHLSASYEKVWKSALKGSNKQLIHANYVIRKNYLFAIKSVLSKFVIDTLTYLLYRNKNYKIIPLKYEDIIDDTLNSINLICEKCNIDNKSIKDCVQVNEFYIKSGYSGNRLRNSNEKISIKKS